jgi:hypothetical protein
MKAPGTIEDRNGRVRVRFTVKSGGRVVRPSYDITDTPEAERDAKRLELWRGIQAGTVDATVIERGTMRVDRFAESVGVKEGTMRRWIHEGMPGVVRDLSHRAVAVELEIARPWVEAKRASGRCWAFDRKTCVYFAQCRETGEIKIGFTQDVTARVRELEKQSKGGRHVEVLALLPGDKQTELAIHAMFADLRTDDGEWFRPGEALMTFVQRLARSAA